LALAKTNIMKLKVCGLTKINQIQELISLNTNFLGFIFYEKSPRFVLNHLSLDEISEINHQGKVGVFVNETVEKLTEISEKSNLNFIQLHGDEDEEFIKRLRQMLNENTKIIKVIRIGDDKKNFENEIKKMSNLKSQISNLLFDTDSKAFGGTGKTFDWQILNEIEIPIPYFLSGGISLENIHQLSTINHQPLAIDINSKFEIEPGNKNLEKIKKFTQIVNKIY
jgi:phosphoribosylanthranilate isomerase